jgi:glycosyltransferase involved in cell wall biosynthesis
MDPLVSFVVPCYNLAHFLGECVQSLLAQSYTKFEILILDDCSPDNTAEIATSFLDPRVRFIRNDQNLGHLRNYNKGIAAAIGKYVWLISADDVLRQPYALDRYVQVMEANPSVGYVFSPAVRLFDGRQLGTLSSSVCSSTDTIINGREWLAKLIHRNCIVAPSVMVRKSCYESLGAFPLNLPWNGDWYLWCLFALHFDVAYIAEPMVCYREHELNISHSLLAQSSSSCAAADLAMPWIIKPMAERLGFSWLAGECVRSAASEYLRRAEFSDPSTAHWQLERWLDDNGARPEDKAIGGRLIYSRLNTPSLQTCTAATDNAPF